MWSSQASSSAANSPSGPVPARRANSLMAVNRIHAFRHSWRRAAEMMPSSWSSEHPASPEPSSPVTVSTTVASSGPGAIVSAWPFWANPDRVSSSAGRVTNRPCSGPGASPSGGKPPGSASSGPGSGNRAWGTRHAPFGRNIERRRWEHNIIQAAIRQLLLAYTFELECGVNCMQLGGGRMMAMPRVAQVPDIRRVDLPEARQAIPHVHAYLRECILDGTLPPGTKLSQVSLAAQLGISRTPLREVLRMLQEEGLVEFEPNQRTRVAGLDPAELDDIYASRILLETLALSMTIGHFGAKARSEAKRLLTAMRRAAKSGDFDAWFAAHTEYHRVCTAAAG